MTGRQLTLVAFTAVVLASATAGAIPAIRTTAPPILIGVERKNEASLAIHERPGSSVARFEFSGCPRPADLGTGEPYGLEAGNVAPDPRWFAITCDAEDRDWIELLSADGRKNAVRATGSATDLTTPLWSRHSRAVAYLSGDFSCSAPKRPTPVELWVARPTGEARRVGPITVARDVVLADVESWSPTGGSLLVQTAEFNAECRFQEHWRDTLYIVTVGKRRAVRRLIRYDLIGHADYSPDGRLIAVTHPGARYLLDSCQLDVIEPNGHAVRTVATFDYVLYGCYGDGLTSRWVPSSERIVFSNGTTVFEASPRTGAVRELYRARPRRRDCDIDTSCPGLKIVDVAASGHVLTRSESPSLGGADRYSIVDPSGTSTRVVVRPGETPLRFAR